MRTSFVRVGPVCQVSASPPSEETGTAWVAVTAGERSGSTHSQAGPLSVTRWFTWGWCIRRRADSFCLIVTGGAHVRVPWLWGKWVVVTVVGWWQDWCRLTGTGLIWELSDSCTHSVAAWQSHGSHSHDYIMTMTNNIGSDVGSDEEGLQALVKTCWFRIQTEIFVNKWMVKIKE